MGSSKHNKKKEKKERKVKKEKNMKQPDFTPDHPLPTFPNQAFMPQQQQPMGMASPWGMPPGMGFGVPQSPMASMFPSMPSTPMSFQSTLMQNMPPPPPMLEGMESMDPSLHSLLLSWYMAGYQAGRYQTSQANVATKAKSKSKSPVKS